MPLPEEAAPTPLEDCSPLDDDDDEEDEVEVEDEVSELVDAAELAVCVDDVDLPGMVAALMAVSSPTPPKAATAAPAVRRFNKRKAASRARTLACIEFVLSMVQELEALRCTEPRSDLRSY